MAPEIINKQYYSGPQVDIWAAGVVLYAMLTGDFPFKGIYANYKWIGHTDNELYSKITGIAINYQDVIPL